MSTGTVHRFDLSAPIDLGSKAFAESKYELYPRLLEEAPVCTGKVSVLEVTLLSRFEDCRWALADERFIRNRGRAKGKKNASPLPIPLPKFLAVVANNMIYEDGLEHRRHRNLVNKAFTSRSVRPIETRVEQLCHDLIDRLDASAPIDLLEAYARVIPARVIGELLGIEEADVEEFDSGLRVLTEGFSGWSVLRTLLFDMRRLARFVRELVRRKRAKPADDLLTALIHAEEEGARLSEDQLVAMVFLLISAGFETTVHMIGNGVRTLVEEPEALARLRSTPTLWPSAAEELVRYRGPVHGTKPIYPIEDVEIQGQVIPRGQAVMPLLGAANQDPRAFDRPEVFDVARTPNHHLGFGFGEHFCLGKPLALMETRVALRALTERHPDLRLAVPAAELPVVNMPGWHRHAEMPVLLKG